MSAITLTNTERQALREAHAKVLRPSLVKRIAGPLVILGTIAYAVFCWFFFDIGTTIAEGRWDRTVPYLADWVTWEAQPRYRFRDGGVVEIEHQRFSPLGENPDPDWMLRLPDGRDAVTFRDFADRVEIAPREVLVYLAGTPYGVALTDGAAVMPPDAPAAFEEKNGRVTVHFGFAGSAEIRNTQVLIRRRFFGWENFWFDTQSPFWDMSPPELIASAVSSERIDPARSNLSLIISEFLTNSEWQHGDVFNKLLQTIVMAFVGTLFACLLAFPLAFIAARNITRNRPLSWITKRFFDFTRSVDMLIWALVFVRGFGPGPLAGISAIFVTDTGTFGKLYSETLENIDDKQREGVKSVGAGPMSVQRYGVMPQVLPAFASQALYFWESNTRGATIIGAVGAGGIGLKLLEAMRTNADWENVAYMVCLILVVVYVFDGISNAIRSRLIGRASR
ncbi:phosphonate ABC transporter, permease protein PhnE [Devosia nitrariae]|uniref:Phosphonate ABC transporter, permease protein PhnE n=1 Tax=Devosia nitrariae TaxID=2071872 RepID=A0ABQ5W6R6_9HYPH|nr:phosphonate ABC transporter, permease protein PhnE [Devosia nitrariae]GLQ55656.1 phosphonate ABC transporter, permease protein PhnE [Devosia nitrariae]